MSIKQISVFVENKPGALYGLTGVLAQNGVDLRALSLAETSEFGIVRIIVDNLYQAATVLKDASYVHSLTPVVGVAIPDVPGGLNKVLQAVSYTHLDVYKRQGRWTRTGRSWCRTCGGGNSASSA